MSVHIGDSVRSRKTQRNGRVCGPIRFSKPDYAGITVLKFCLKGELSGADYGDQKARREEPDTEKLGDLGKALFKTRFSFE